MRVGRFLRGTTGCIIPGADNEPLGSRPWPEPWLWIYGAHLLTCRSRRRACHRPRRGLPLIPLGFWRDDVALCSFYTQKSL